MASSIKTYCQETPHNNITSHQTVPRVETQCWATECSPPAICSSAIADQNFVIKLICINLKSYKYSQTLIFLGKLRKRAEQSDVCRLKCRLLLTGGAPKSSIRRFVITEKAPTRAFSWLKAATTAFTCKTLLRHYAKWALTPQSLNVKLGPRRNYHKGRAAIRHYANQTARPL